MDIPIAAYGKTPSPLAGEGWGEGRGCSRRTVWTFLKIALSEPSETFLQVLAFFEKVGVIASIADWQTCRTARNLAAHSYETDYESIAEHFNTLHEMRPVLYVSAREFVSYCRVTIGITPASEDFADDFIAIVGGISQ